MAALGLADPLGSQVGSEAGHGALELTSGLGPRLYALPDDESVITARKGHETDPNNVEPVLSFQKRRRRGGSTERPWRCAPNRLYR
jgi:hypothetical protein